MNNSHRDLTVWRHGRMVAHINEGNNERVFKARKVRQLDEFDTLFMRRCINIEYSTRPSYVDFRRWLLNKFELF